MMIRFADVLLMGSELRSLVNGAGDGVALGYLNRVRERAFWKQFIQLQFSFNRNYYAERRLNWLAKESDITTYCARAKADFSKLATILTYVDDTDGRGLFQLADTESLDVDGNTLYTQRIISDSAE
jgi:hypothetical protein